MGCPGQTLLEYGGRAMATQRVGQSRSPTQRLWEIPPRAPQKLTESGNIWRTRMDYPKKGKNSLIFRFWKKITDCKERLLKLVYLAEKGTSNKKSRNSKTES